MVETVEAIGVGTMASVVVVMVVGSATAEAGAVLVGACDMADAGAALTRHHRGLK